MLTPGTRRNRCDYWASEGRFVINFGRREG